MNRSFSMLFVTLSAVLLLGVSGCKSTPEVSTSEQQEHVGQENVHQEPDEPVEYPLRPFDKETLYQLLLAEIAGYRKNYDLALENYALEAVKTRDAGVAARATRLAAYLKRDDIAAPAAELWAELEPDSLEAHRHAAEQAIRAGNLSIAVAHMESVKRLGGLANFNAVAYRAGNLDQEERDLLLATISEMLVQYPEDEQLLFSKAVLLEQSNRTEEALYITEKLLGDSPDINVVILRVNALKRMGQIKTALKLLEKEVKQRPEHRRLKVFYARVLFDEGLLDRARQQYENLLLIVPRDGDILFALALIAMEQEREMLAIEYFSRMIEFGQRVGEANYYLGTLMEKIGDPARALRHYRQAGLGYEFLPTQARITDILATSGQVDEARNYIQNLIVKNPEREVQLVLLEAQMLADHSSLAAALEFMSQQIVKDSDNVEYRYFRAMTGERNNDLALLESDLRHIIALNPDNADAMNALGYTLADKTDRYEEALILISRALEIKPNEAAFIDSIGWVHYRLENYDQAIRFLRQALDMFPNDEVAAHLGEVLWVAGNRTEASKVWQQGLELAPDSKILQEVIGRFK